MLLFKITCQSGEVVFEIPRLDLFEPKFTAHLIQELAIFGIGLPAEMIKPGKDLLRTRALAAKHEDRENGVGVVESKFVSQVDGLADALAIERRDLRASSPSPFTNLTIGIVCDQIAQLCARV